MTKKPRTDILGISINGRTGIGDALQFSSLPENYFRATNRKLVDVSRPWFFDHNPYVERTDRQLPSAAIQELWNFTPTQYVWPRPRGAQTGCQVYLSNAEIWASLLNVAPVLNRPRLYKHEEHPYWQRDTIYLHTLGRSHGNMPQYVIDHVLEKYGAGGNLCHFGAPGSPDLPGRPLPKVEPKDLWEAAALISKARMFIGLDSGPSWIAMCYPDVVLKRLRCRPELDYFRDWVPLEIDNIHSHWDDRGAQIFNVSGNDIGFTRSYLAI